MSGGKSNRWAHGITGMALLLVPMSPNRNPSIRRSPQQNCMRADYITCNRLATRGMRRSCVSDERKDGETGARASPPATTCRAIG